MKRVFSLVLLAVLSAAISVQADIVKRDVPAGSTGFAENGATIVARKGSVVYARTGSNVQYWPGSKLVPVSSAASLPDCSQVAVRASGLQQELFVESGAQACTAGDVAVIAQEGSTVIYDDGVALIRRPVVRR